MIKTLYALRLRGHPMHTSLLLVRYATSLLTTLRTAQYQPLALIPPGLNQ
jgi:hypothetical protein